MTSKYNKSSAPLCERGAARRAEEFEKQRLCHCLLAPTDTFFNNSGAVYTFNTIAYECFYVAYK